MTSSSDTFPFGIADVVELLGLTVRRRLPSSLYLNCPFCGDLRGRLNVNTDKNVWRCNRCGAAGGMLALYARYNCTGNADAYGFTLLSLFGVLWRLCCGGGCFFSGRLRPFLALDSIAR